MVPGLTEILCVVCPPGDQIYVPPPVDGVAVKVVDAPAQMDSELTVTVADPEEVIVTLAVSGQSIEDETTA